jgi:hypothetical protein
MLEGPKSSTKRVSSYLLRKKGQAHQLELTLKNTLDTIPTIPSGEICPMGSDEYERKIESLAEDLVARMTRLHKRSGALLQPGISRKERAKIQAWADMEKEELLRLKKTIRRRKQSYAKTIPTQHLALLGNHHPVWKTHYDVYMDQIQATTLAREGEQAYVRCTLKPNTLALLKIFCYAGEGTVLCVNSDRGLRYEEGRPEQSGEVRWMLLNDTFYPLRRNMFRMVERIRAQWVFTDDTWGLSENILWLAFGTGKGQS